MLSQNIIFLLCSNSFIDLKQNVVMVVKEPSTPILLWFGNGDCGHHRSEYKDHVWSYDFVHERTKDKRSFRILTVIDEFTRESLGTVVRRMFTSLDVIEVLYELFITRWLPKHIPSDNGPAFTSTPYVFSLLKPHIQQHIR
jgi:transposase InsO family protein